MEKITTKDKKNAVITGVLFIIAAIAAILGLQLYSPVLDPSGHLVHGDKYSNQVVSGAIFELILACSAAGTGIMLFPYLKKFNQNLGLGYVCFRMLEVVFIIIGIISVLSLLTLHHSFSLTTDPDMTSFQTGSIILKAIHDWTFILGPNFMLGVNTFIYSYVFYQSKLIPRKLSMLGILGAILIFIAALLEMFGIILQISLWGVLLAIPVFLYEMILAIWLISKGFNKEVWMQKNNS